MDIRIIEKALREYKIKKSKVESTLARIEAWSIALNNPDEIVAIYNTSSRELGMPRGSDIRSPVEIAITDKEEAIEIIKEWIKDDESRIIPLKLEVEQVEIALESLTVGEKYVIDCKYFNNMFWNNIEINYNERFREKNYVTVARLRQINQEALSKLVDILTPFYNRNMKTNRKLAEN